MRVALISDIHGNLVALETVLSDLERDGLDRVLCPGDVAATGPQPHETVERLRDLAEYALVSSEAGDLRIEMRLLPMRTRAAVRSALQSAMLHAEWWAGFWNE